MRRFTGTGFLATVATVSAALVQGSQEHFAINHGFSPAPSHSWSWLTTIKKIATCLCQFFLSRTRIPSVASRLHPQSARPIWRPVLPIPSECPPYDFFFLFCHFFFSAPCGDAVSPAVTPLLVATTASAGVALGSVALACGSSTR